MRITTSFKNLYLAAFAFFAFCLVAVGQPTNFLARCPYDAQTWPYPESGTLGCPIATFSGGSAPCADGYTFKPQQDCCGALPICSLVAVVNSIRGNINETGFNAAICGSGCRPGEIPPLSCLASDERQTSWYIFEVRPLPGGSQDLGAYAGRLRFKIFPCDLQPNNPGCDQTLAAPPCDCEAVIPDAVPYCTEDGSSSFGTVDYDWEVYKINSARTRRRACDIIRDNTSLSISCNYSGLSGPTGIFEPGALASQPAGGTRLNGPFDVAVGDRFILAVDGFTSNNLKGYKIDFRGTCANEARFGPTADISLRELGAEIDTITADTNYCATGGISLKYDFAIDPTELAPYNFKIYNRTTLDSNFQVSDIISLTGSDTSSTFKLFFTPGNAGRYALVYRDTIRDFCGDRIIVDTNFFNIVQFSTASQPLEPICASPRESGNLAINFRQNFDFPPRFEGDPDTVNLRINVIKWEFFNPLSNAFDSIAPNSTVFGNLRASSPSYRQTANANTNRLNWSRARVLSLSDSLVELPGNPTIVSYRFRGTITMPLGREANPLSTGCTQTHEFTIRFRPMPSVSFTQEDSTCIALGEQTFALRNTLGSRTYTWFRVNEPTGGGPLIDSVAEGISYTAPVPAGDADYYRIRVVDNETGCSNIIPDPRLQAITFRNAADLYPGINFEIEGSSQVLPANVIFRNTTTRLLNGDNVAPPAGVTYVWDFGNGDRQIVTDINEAFTRAYGERADGKDTVQVCATLRAYDNIAQALDISACSRDTTVCLILRGKRFPNLITPGTGLPENQVLRFDTRGGNVALEVYNRYGSLVYNNTNYANNWAAEDVPGGVYYYLVKILETNETFKGWVQVVK